MNSSDPLTHRTATEADCESLATLINISYRGELANQGWTNENSLVGGLRTNTNVLSTMINSGKYKFLAFFDKTDLTLKGCVYLQHKPETKTAYLGMLSVRPDVQGKGYGKFILSTAEKYAVSDWNVDYIEMRVFVQRSELLAYYFRRGYNVTDLREPFLPNEDAHLIRDDLEFCTLRKCMKTSEDTISA